MAIKEKVAHLLRRRPVPAVDELVADVIRYAKSFAGLSVAETRTRLKGAEFSEEQCNDDRLDARLLTAKFQEHEVWVFFCDGKATNALVMVHPS